MQTEKRVEKKEDGGGNGEKTPKIRTASKSSLPEAVQFLDDETFHEVYMDMTSARSIRAKISELEEELEQIRGRLGSVAVAFGLEKGFRSGLIGFEWHGYQTRKTLNKDLLIENGVTAEQIEKSMKEGEPYLSTKFVDFDVL